MPTIIDWSLILVGYNDNYGTHYSSLFILMYDLYNREQSCKRMDEILGISRNTIHRKLVELGVPTQNRGWSKDRIGTKTKKIKEIAKEKIKNMTSEEIAKEIGCSRQQVWRVMENEKIKYNKKKRGRPRGSKCL